MAITITECPKCGYMPNWGERICPKCKELFITKVVKSAEEIIEESIKDLEDKCFPKNPIPYCTSYI